MPFKGIFCEDTERKKLTVSSFTFRVITNTSQIDARQGSQLRGINIYRKKKQPVLLLWEECAEDDLGTDRKLRILAAITASA